MNGGLNLYSVTEVNLGAPRWEGATALRQLTVKTSGGSFVLTLCADHTDALCCTEDDYDENGSPHSLPGCPEDRAARAEYEALRSLRAAKPELMALCDSLGIDPHSMR